MTLRPRRLLPVEVVFHPHWWYCNYGLTFGEEFFFDPDVRVEGERQMRRLLYERFGDLGLGEKDPLPRPVIGQVHLAAGFLPSAILGCEVLFAEDAPPAILPRNLTDDEVRALQVPDILDTPIMQRLVAMMDRLQERFGYLEGDVNWGGVQNVALDLRGQQLLLDYYENPDLAFHLLDVVSRTIANLALYIRSRTGSTSIAVNRIVASVDPALSLHSNCSVTMVSNATYERFLLPYDNYLAQRLQPYGIHHCGADMEHVVEGYSKVQGVSFFDVGWGSDVARCRAGLPGFFSLRMSPVRVRECTVDAVQQDVEQLLRQAGDLTQAGICCINMDDGTPDENVRAIFHVVDEYRRTLSQA
jgi:hypothetical protein